jgi:hypothetical protein
VKNDRSLSRHPCDTLARRMPRGGNAPAAKAGPFSPTRIVPETRLLAKPWSPGLDGTKRGLAWRLAFPGNAFGLRALRESMLTTQIYKRCVMYAADILMGGFARRRPIEDIA